MGVGDGRFSGLAALSLLGFAVVLGVVALAGLRPWEADTVDPHLSISPSIGGALGDAVALGRDRVGPGKAQRDAGIGLAAATSVAAPTPAPGDSGVRLAVARAQPVGVERAQSPPSSEPESTAPPLAQAPPPTAVAPVAEPVPSAPGPIAAGVLPEPDEICEGDEYEVRISFDTTLVEGATVVVILIRRAGDDQAEDQVLVEGELSELLDLLESLTSEGDCVKVVVEPGEAETALP